MEIKIKENFSPIKVEIVLESKDDLNAFGMLITAARDKLRPYRNSRDVHDDNENAKHHGYKLAVGLISKAFFRRRE